MNETPELVSFLMDAAAGECAAPEAPLDAAPRQGINPAVTLLDVTVAPPNAIHTDGDAERLIRAITEASGLIPEIGFAVMTTLQARLRAAQWRVTCVIALGDGGQAPRVIDLWPVTPARRAYGLALDIGSTTLAAYLCDLMSGEVIANAKMVNPQVTYGADVMSRVSHSMMHPGAHLQMTAAVRDGVRHLTAEVTKRCGIETAEVLDAVVVCNPIMHHLYLGFDPYELGQAPFTFATSKALHVAVRDIELPIHPRAQAYVLPAVGNHVGADAAAVMLCEDLHRSETMTLVIDIGTNAEFFLGNSKGIVASSSPTGPALEGAEITHGQRAAPGAIERVRIHPLTKEIRFKVIGSELWSDDPAFEASIRGIGVTGICGSGVIEMVAEMRMAGLIDPTGRIGTRDETGCAACFADGRTTSVTLYRGERHIYVTNNDVREVQMAKAALYASLRLLMDDLGVSSVDRIVLAGAFGSHISVKHAMVLGLVPDCALEHVSAVGNAAGAGACVALMDIEARRQIERAVQHVRNVETATHADFQAYFMSASDIPNAEDRFPSLAARVVLPEVAFGKRSSRKSPDRKQGRH
ncbi:ASKHA domain-containing protein [Pararhodobacter oceanensis]|uniref:ASKHA domain-containing protein n=1 Tax=Pararhodobacter oceanensis TaxID=2172121 RepID=UPI003A8D5D02